MCSLADKACSSRFDVGYSLSYTSALMFVKSQSWSGGAWKLPLQYLGLCVAALWPALLEAAQPRGPATTEYFQVCDASAVAFLDEAHFAVANDEDNLLRVYRLGEPEPVTSLEVSGFLQLDKKRPESDLEGAARAGDLVWWIGSHGRNAEGQRAPNRQRLFATRIVPGAVGKPGLAPHGVPYMRLLDDLLTAPALRGFDLDVASSRAPKEDDGLNIEGLAAAPDGRLWLGFRNPVPKGHALLVPILNPEAVLQGGRARLGDPVRLDLGGLGVRDLIWAGDRCFVLAGPIGGGGSFRVFVWRGPGSPAQELRTRFPKRFNAEAVGWHPRRSPAEVFVLSDDGTRKIEDCDCKELTDPAQRRFRAAWFPTGLN